MPKITRFTRWAVMERMQKAPLAYVGDIYGRFYVYNSKHDANDQCRKMNSMVNCTVRKKYVVKPIEFKEAK